MGEKFENPYADRIVGIPSKEKAEKEAAYNEWFTRLVEGHGGKELDGELEKTPQEIALINLAQDSAREFLAQHGRKKDIQIPLSHIHILGEGVRRMQRGSEGVAIPHLASAVIDRDKSGVKFSLVAFHELMHLKAYQAFWVGMQGETIRRVGIENHRSGFQVMIKEEGKWVRQVHFVDFEEAIVGLMTARFWETVLKNSDLVKDEVEQMEREGTAPEITRQEELAALNQLIDDLWAKNREATNAKGELRYKSRDAIVDLFIDAQMNGRLLGVGKLIERTFGKGSFRSEKYSKETPYLF